MGDLVKGGVRDLKKKRNQNINNEQKKRRPKRGTSTSVPTRGGKGGDQGSRHKRKISTKKLHNTKRGGKYIYICKIYIRGGEYMDIY